MNLLEMSHSLFIFCTIVVIFCSFVGCDQPWQAAKQNGKKIKDVHRCFCELNGLVDDCTCRVESVSEFNNLKVHPRLRSLVERNFFKFFKVNLKRPCPFWPDDTRCAMKGCHVCPCSPDDLPCGLKEELAENKYSSIANKGVEENTGKLEERGQCEEEEDELGALDTTISKENLLAFETWKEHDDAQLNFCEPEDEHSEDMEYVDLLINPERYTGYKGHSPHRIWRSIYDENCFKPDQRDQLQVNYGDFLNHQNVKDMCLEKRVFYRLISGLHTSINVHLSYHYLNPESVFGPEKWGPNVKEFQQRFDPETTEGEGPIRLKNLYFTYLVVLRAIAKSRSILQNEMFYTGDAVEDNDVQIIVREILDLANNFENHFNENAMFKGDQQQALQMKEEFRTHFRNISRIMDCVGCDKCKLWGKLQVRGLGTALKILFTEERSPGWSKLRLSRGEIVALFNGFGKLSSSIRMVEEFQQLLSQDKSKSTNPWPDMS